jgi:hypothetical protein
MDPLAGAPLMYDGYTKSPVHRPEILILPFKANAASRHHIPKQRQRVTNSAAYDATLRQRGSLTVWFTEAVIAA